MSDDVAQRLRSESLDALAREAMDFSTQRHIQVGIELQRRVIAESAKASRRLLIATWVIAGLTVVLIALTIAEFVSALD